MNINIRVGGYNGCLLLRVIMVENGIPSRQSSIAHNKYRLTTNVLAFLCRIPRGVHEPHIIILPTLVKCMFIIMGRLAI